MRRGFKSWCERAATEYHQILGVPVGTALDAHALAEHLGVRVVLPKDVPGVQTASLEQLTVTDRDSWSAVTITRGGRRLVILNSGHPETRQANSLAHELAHIILNHRSDDAKVSREGLLFRNRFDEEQEDEANWLAGCLLLPREGLLRGYLATRNRAALARRFRVSPDLIEWRLRMTGIPRQAKRAVLVR